MSKKQVRLGFSSDILRMFVEFRVPFKLTITNSSVKIVTDDSTWLISPKHLSYKELGFVSQVKKHAIKLDKPVMPYSRNDINYFKFGNIARGVYRNVSEFDVNSAYWEIAYRSGYLKKSTYEKGKDVSKMARLVALGSLATMKRHYYFNGVKFLDKKDIEVNETTRSFFFHIAKQLDDIMSEAWSKLPEDKRYVFWVDAFFVDSDCEGIISDVLESHDLKYKHKEVKQINCFDDYKTKTRKVVATMVEKRWNSKTDIYLKPFTKPSTAAKENDVKESIRAYNAFFR